MLKLSIKSWVFMFLTFFLLISAVFYFRLGYAQNIRVKFSEIFNQAGLLTASLIFNPEELPIRNSSNLEDDLPFVQDEQNQILTEEPSSDFVSNEKSALYQMTQQEVQEELDDIAEKIDLIKQQVAELTNSLPQTAGAKLEEDNKKDDKTTKEEIKTQEELQLQSESQNDRQYINSGGRPIYPKVLISEIQTAGQEDEKQEFVELYNPNDFVVDLTGWYLQRKTAGGSSWSTYAPNTLFSGKIISAGEYFLIARTGYYSVIADIFADNSITDDNSFALKNPNGDISDKSGFGLAQDPELLPAINPGTGQTIGRKILSDGTEQDTDNNSNDFELQSPTPKEKNITFVEPMEPVPKESLKNILINEAQISPIGQRFIELYNPNNQEVNLTGWYLQRKTEIGSDYASFVPKNDFFGKTIPANWYFLISRQIENSDILSDITLSKNNSLVLKNLNGDISDKLGFGAAKDFENTPASNPDPEKSIGRKWDENTQNYLDTDDNSADFELDTPSPKEKNIKWVEPPKDTIPPEVNFTLAPMQNSISFAINFTITDPLDVVTPSGISSYIFRWKEETGDWQEDLPAEIAGHPISHNSTRDFTGEDQKTYYFQMKAKDLAGNESGLLPTEPVFTKIEIPEPVETKPIVINEIQTDSIDGTGGTDDDWIELYNPNDFEIFLNNYNGSYLRLVKRSKTSASDTTIKSWSSDPDAKIPAKGFYLWVSSTDSNYPLLVQADSSTKQNISSDNGVALRSGPEDTGEIIDAIGWGEFNNVLFEGVSAQNPPGGKSIQRKNLGEDTNDNSRDFVISDTPTPKSE